MLDEHGVGPNSDIGKGITWAVDHGAQVINVSIGSDTKAASVTTAVSYAVAHGVVVVAAAGNGGPSGNPRYPAALPETIAVGALGQNGDVASYSTNGSYVDLTAPGLEHLLDQDPLDLGHEHRDVDGVAARRRARWR